MAQTFQTDAVRPVDGFAHPTTNNIDMEKAGNGNIADTNSDNDSKSVESEKFQDGVQRVRAITEIWGKNTMIAMFIFLFLIEFVAFLQNAVDSSLNLWITSEFGSHGLLTVGNVIATALAGCIPLAMAKFIDVFGRVEGFFVMLIMTTVGMALKAACKNVQTYVGGHVLYWAGHIGILYVTDVMAADITTLKNRMLIFTINSTPRICSTFAGPKIADLFYYQSSWRNAFVAFIFIFIGCSLPAMGIMIYMFRKAKNAGVITKKEKSGRTPLQSIWYYFVQFDITGILLLMFAFCLFVLPFTLVAYAPNGWKTGYIIAMIVLGILLFPAFALYEMKIAPVPFLPWKYLKERTIVGSCLLYGTMFLSVFVWNTFFQSYLIVVHRQSIPHAGYILNSFSLSSSLFSPGVAFIIAKTGNFKWTSYTGVPILLIGTALLIPFRTPSTNPGVIAFTQVLVGLGTGIFATCAQLAVMSPISHQEIAAVLALWGLFGSFGSSIGVAIASAMWNNLLPQELLRRLPDSSKADYLTIFGSVAVQNAFPDGTPERDAVVGAYAHVQRLFVITGACLIPLCFLSIALWKNINVRRLEEEKGKQTKGTVF